MLGLQNKYLMSQLLGVQQVTEALSVHFSSRKKVRLKARDRENARKGGRRYCYY